MRAGIQFGALTLALLALSGGHPAPADDAVPAARGGAEPLPWVWVVPSVILQPGEDWVLSGLYAGLGGMDLQLQLVDRQGRIAAEARWELVAGQPADYRLAGLDDAPVGARLSLLIAGLEAGPQRLALSLWWQRSGGGWEELAGSWIHSDPSLLPGVRSGP